jgi:hypothetical protein
MDDPTQDNLTTRQKKEYLFKLSSTIVDKYILDGEKHKQIAAAIHKLEERQLQRLKEKTSDGRYKCRYPGFLGVRRHLPLTGSGDKFIP